MEASFVVPKTMSMTVSPLEKKLMLSTRNPKAWAAIKKLMREQEEIDAKIERIKDANCITGAELRQIIEEARAEAAAQA